MFARTLSVILVVTLLRATGANAQTQPAQSAPATPRFDTDIVVTPERGETPRPLIPASTVVVDRAAISTLPAAMASEIASFLPGYSVLRAPYYAGRPVVSARGFFGGGEADYILLLLDGVPISDVESGLVDWSLVPITSIRRIEAFRGPGASLYGDSAIGGVVQILTDRAGGSRVNTTGGSFSTFTADATHGRRFGSAGFHLSGMARHTNGAFEHSGGRQVLGGGSADGRSDRLSWRLNATGEDRRLDDPGSLSRTAAAIDPSASDPSFQFDGVDRNNLSTALTVRFDALGFRPQARAYVASRNDIGIRTILLAPGLGDRRAREIDSVAVGGSFEGEHRYGNDRGIMRFGLDLAREHLDTAYHSVTQTGDIGTLNSDVSGRRLRTGVFVSSSWDAMTRVRLYGALRWDDVDDAGFGGGSGTASRQQRAWSPRGGVTVQLTDTGVAAYVQVSRAFKAPTLDQLFDPRPYPDFTGGTFTISNRDLVPQRATNVEGGISGGRSVRWHALAYRMDVEDEIDFDLRTFSYGNIGRSTHTGLEVEAESQWGPYLRPTGAYALARVVDADTDRQLKNVPRHVATIGADIALPWTVAAYVRYRKSWGAFLDDDHLFAIDGASTVELRVRRPIRQHALFLDALNLTGNNYEEYGFTLTDFAGRAVPFIYPGARRAIRAGATIVF